MTEEEFYGAFTESNEDSADAGERSNLSGWKVPVGREQAHELKNDPLALWLWFKLRAETIRCRWGEETKDDATGTIHWRGLAFDRIEPGTCFLVVKDWTRKLGMSAGSFYSAVCDLFDAGCLDALHVFDATQAKDGIEWPGSEYPGSFSAWRCLRSLGTPLDTLIEMVDGWCCGESLGYVFVVQMADPGRVKGGFVWVPQEAGSLPPEQLRFLLLLYLKARYRKPTKETRGGATQPLHEGELLFGYRQIGRELGDESGDVHPETVKRWGKYALKKGLLQRIPKGRDALWRVTL